MKKGLETGQSGAVIGVKEMIRVLTALAHGTDPHTGLVFPPEAPYNHPDTIRTLFAVLERLKNPGDRSGNPDAGERSLSRRWTDELDEELSERYLAGAALPELVREMRRSRGALISRLILLGLIDDADHVRD
jgi:LmbE family N-acetylglucosaminyl deacetylase